MLAGSRADQRGETHATIGSGSDYRGRPCLCGFPGHISERL